MSDRKVLVVEDDLDTRTGIGIRLKSAGFKTAFAADAVSAIKVARDEKPDVVLLDLGLPGGDGFKVLERLRMNMHLADIPVVVLSAWDPRDHEKRAMETGASAYLQKPAENAELIATLNKCF